MQDKGGVDGLKDELYSRKHQDGMRDVRAPLSASDEQAPVSWKVGEDGLSRAQSRERKQPFDSAQGDSRMGIATKFFIGSAVFFVVAMIGALIFFFTGGNYISSSNIDLQIVAPALVDGGTLATLQFIVTNRNPTELQLADLVVSYPEGTRSPKDPTKALTHERISIGTISSGRQVKLTSSAIFYGGEGSAQKVKASLEYSVAGSNAIFTKENETSITVGSSPVSVSVEAPTETIAGQLFTMSVTIQSNAQAPVEDVLVEAQYPFGFSVSSVNPRAAAGSTVWRLGTMAPGTTQVINITGSIDGQDGDERVFRFKAGTTKDETGGKIEVPFLSVPVTLTVHRPFITGSISVEGKTGEKISAQGGKTLQASVRWQNNLSESVSDVQVTLKLSGPMLDRSSIQSGNGFYQSNDSTITWTSAQDPSLAAVPPGGTGTLQFSFATLPAGTGGIIYTNPTVELALTVGAVRAGQGNVPQQVSSAATMQVTIASAATLAVQTLHTTGPFSNSGPLPPRAESQTTYTIVWTVKNSSNTLANTTVSTVLPPYVEFIQGQTGISYDSGSRTVRWDLGDVKAGVGYSSAAQQGAFQVRFNPSASQVGQAPALSGAAALSGTDRFAQIQVSASAEAPTTRLTEAGFAAGMEVVQPKQ